MTSLDQHIRGDLPGRFNELDMIRRNWERYRLIARGEVLPPFEVLIHPSSVCNLRCQWCIGDHVPLEVWDDERGALIQIDAAKTSSELLPDNLRSPEQMQRLVQDLVNYEVTRDLPDGPQTFGIDNVSFSGLIGEPLVNRASLVPAIDELNRAGKRTGIFTNGILIDEKIVDVVAQMAYVHISLDAASGRTYAKLKYNDKVNGVKMFERAVASIARLDKRRKLMQTGLQLSVSFILYPDNFTEVFEAASIAKSQGADTFRVKRDISFTRMLDEDAKTAAKNAMHRIGDELVDETFEFVPVHNLEMPQSLVREFGTCRVTDMIAAIGSDGHLYPCNYHPRPGGLSYGSALEQGFRAVWEGQKRIDTKRLLPSHCPPTCDPFKGRANHLLERIEDHVAEVGRDVAEGDLQDLIGAGLYRQTHFGE